MCNFRDVATTRHLAVLGLLVSLIACAEEPAQVSPGVALFETPPGFPEMRVPDDNPLTAEKAELGRFLFHDERLSSNGSSSCRSCHEQARAFSDGRVTAIDAAGHSLLRNSLSLGNVAYRGTLTWANPNLTALEDHLLEHLFGSGPASLGESADAVLSQIAADETYQRLFADAFFDDGSVTREAIVRALASFARTIVSGNSPFDRYLYYDEGAALTDSARRGMGLFFSERLECHHCHGGFSFAESSVHLEVGMDAEPFHNIGLYDVDGSGAYPEADTGLYSVTGRPEDMGRFRAPSLRNVAATGPYMHDGSIETLDEVVRVYEAGGRVLIDGPFAGDGRSNPLKSELIKGVTLTDEEREDLLSFLSALTDADFLVSSHLADPFEDDRPL